MEMGFPEEVSKEALEKFDGDVTQAINFLLGGWPNKYIKTIDSTK